MKWYQPGEYIITSITRLKRDDLYNVIVEQYKFRNSIDIQYPAFCWALGHPWEVKDSKGHLIKVNSGVIVCPREMVNIEYTREYIRYVMPTWFKAGVQGDGIILGHIQLWKV